MDSDLEKVIKDRSIILSQANIKSYMQMIFRALHACHSHFVVHRDVKVIAHFSHPPSRAT